MYILIFMFMYENFKHTLNEWPKRNGVLHYQMQLFVNGWLQLLHQLGEVVFLLVMVGYIRSLGHNKEEPNSSSLLFWYAQHEIELLAIIINMINPFYENNKVYIVSLPAPGRSALVITGIRNLLAKLAADAWLIIVLSFDICADRSLVMTVMSFLSLGTSLTSSLYLLTVLVIGISLNLVKLTSTTVLQ